MSEPGEHSARMSLIALARRLLLPTAVIGAALAIAGCAAPVFRDTSGVVAIAPLDVQASPSRFHGARVLWGGRIVAISLVPGASEVEVLAYPLDRDLQPRALVDEIFTIVQQLNQQENVSFLLAEQNANLALHYANYAYIIENGRVALSGPADALRARSDVQQFYLGQAALAA